MNFLSPELILIAIVACFAVGCHFGYAMRAREDRQWTEMLLRTGLVEQTAFNAPLAEVTSAASASSNGNAEKAARPAGDRHL